MNIQIFNSSFNHFTYHTTILLPYLKIKRIQFQWIWRENRFCEKRLRVTRVSEIASVCEGLGGPVGSSLQRMVLLSPGDRSGDENTRETICTRKIFCSDHSTWDKPEELAHMTLDTPGAAETRNPVSHHNVIRHPSGADRGRRPPRARSQYRQSNTFQPHYNQQAEEFLKWFE